ncbi:MAG: uroporphyrinogen decarboxylase family protein [Christensenellales bacterium]|jgi:hypothetical protein
MRNSPENIYKAYMGLAPTEVPHWEHFSNPDALTYLTGIDYYAHPRQCALRARELYPELCAHVPATDEPRPHPKGTDLDTHRVRWGDDLTDSFEHGEKYFKTEEDVFAFSPLEHADMRQWKHVVMNGDFRSVESCERFFGLVPDEPPKKAVPGEPSAASFYNTTFMWPLLTFGWEMFLATCLDERFERIMDEFAEINRRVFTAMSRLPVNFIVCHDDIVMTNGPVCSPAWMHKYVFPRYEEYWGMLKQSGKEVLFMADGCMNAFADDVFACGARGIISEPYTDYKAIARKHKDCFIAGEGDNRVLMRNDPAEIRAMVENMVKTAQMSGGYMMCIGNHIPWNIPGEAIKRYIDYSRELARR